MTGNELKQIREKLGATLAEVAKGAKCSISYVKHLQAFGSSPIPEHIVLRLMPALVDLSNQHEANGRDAVSTILGGRT